MVETVKIGNICIPKETYLSMKAAFAQKVGYKPSQGQWEMHNSIDRYRICCAGARFGKSMAGGFEAAFHAAAFADFRVWIVAPVYELAEKEFSWAMEFLSRYEIRPGISLAKMGRLSRPFKGSCSIKFDWLSFITTKSTDNPDSLLGEELDMLVLGEAGRIPKKVYNRELRARIGPREGQIFAASTAAGNVGLFSELLAKGLLNTPGWHTWMFSTIDNPTFSLDEFEEAKKLLDKDTFAEQYEGKLVSRKGLVFSDFDPQIHTVNPKEIKLANNLISIALQPGGQNPTVVLFISYDPTRGQVIVLDEIYDTSTPIGDTLDKAKEYVKGKRVNQGIFTDATNKAILLSLEKKGLRTVINQDEQKISRMHVMAGRAQIVRSMLKPINGKPRFVISSKCVNLLEEFEKCSWPEKPKEEDCKLLSEVPQPKYFQGIQALSHIFGSLYGKVLLNQNLKSVETKGSEKKRLVTTNTKDNRFSDVFLENLK